jgi:HlyD family secretion protein
MSASMKRLAFWGVLGGALVAFLVVAFQPRPVDVDLIAAEQGPLLVTVDEEGETRIRDVFVLSAPIRGRVLRIESEEGDIVIADETVLAEIEPVDPTFLDIRTEAEARAAVNTAKASLALAEAELIQAEAELDFATAERTRTRTLRASETVSQRALDDAERLYKIRAAATETARAAVAMRRSELEAAEARLLRPGDPAPSGGTCPCLPIRAPVSGQVLRVLHESEGVVEPGHPLLEIGDPRDLEIVVDFLSSDAVRIAPGLRVLIEEWGGEAVLNGVVRRVEPFGFTKVSALGIEEQRVNVVIDFQDPPEAWARLGHGFQVEVRVVLGDTPDALKVPLTALFRHADGWAVFAAIDGTAETRPVRVGGRSDLEAEILDGLSPGDIVVRYPNDDLDDGVSVRQR